MGIILNKGETPVLRSGGLAPVKKFNPNHDDDGRFSGGAGGHGGEGHNSSPEGILLNNDIEGASSVRSYDDVGMMTQDSGVVISFPAPTTAEAVTNTLADTLGAAGYKTRTYEDVGMMTSDKGLVARRGSDHYQVTVVDAGGGKKFQVTMVRR